MFRYIYNESDKKTGIIILGVLAILVLFYLFYYYPGQKNKLMVNGRYTIGVVVKIIDGKDANDPEYSYAVNGLTYAGNEARMIQGTYSFSNESIGKRYYILFDSTAPENSCLLPLSPAPDSIITIPENGWHSIPGLKTR
jgi:hypothetical protein